MKRMAIGVWVFVAVLLMVLAGLRLSSDALGMAMGAKPIGKLMRRKITKWMTRKIMDPSERYTIRTFLRSTTYGLIAITCYLSADASERPQTVVEMCNGGYDYWRWYEHGVVTERGGTILANRFLKDCREEYGVQP